MKIVHIITLTLCLGLIATPVYAKHEKNKNKQLPPGLQKKVQKGKPLPPGWQKKLAKGEIMDKYIYQRGEIVVPVDTRGLITIRIEGKLVRLYDATREIVEVLE